MVCPHSCFNVRSDGLPLLLQAIAVLTDPHWTLLTLCRHPVLEASYPVYLYMYPSVLFEVGSVSFVGSSLLHSVVVLLFFFGFVPWGPEYRTENVEQPEGPNTLYYTVQSSESSQRGFLPWSKQMKHFKFFRVNAFADSCFAFISTARV